MEFMISRTSMWLGKRPCEEAYMKNFKYKDIRAFKSFEEYENKFKEKFTDNGTNHRVNERGYIEREFESKAWFIKIDSLEQLLKLTNKYGDIILDKSFLNNDIYSIEIYDDYRE